MSHIVVQVLKLKICGFWIPFAIPQLTAEEAQARVQELRQAATLLSVIPGLIIGEPGSKGIVDRSLCLENISRDTDLSVAAWQVLVPLAPRLSSVSLTGGGWQWSSSMLAAMGRVLGPYVDTLCLGCSLFIEAGQSEWKQLLAALPRLAIVYTRLCRGFDFASCFTGLAEACQSAQRHMLVQVGMDRILNQEAASVANEWVRVERV